MTLPSPNITNGKWSTGPPSPPVHLRKDMCNFRGPTSKNYNNFFSHKLKSEMPAKSKTLGKRSRKTYDKTTYKTKLPRQAMYNLNVQRGRAHDLLSKS